MKTRIDTKEILQYLKNSVWIWVMVFLVASGMFWILYRKLAAPSKEEQINFAITAFAHHDEGLEEKLHELVSDKGIREVNLSYYDLSDPVGMSEYLLTYGFHQADIFLLDTALGQSVLKDCFYIFSQEEIDRLAKAVGHPLSVIREGENIIGIQIHKEGDEEYNSLFSRLHQWILFQAEDSAYDFGLYLHIDSVHNETENLRLLEYILK